MAVTVTYGSNEYNEGVYPETFTVSQDKYVIDRSLTPVPDPQFTTLSLRDDIRLGALRLNTLDENGVIWVCTDIDGWWVQPDPDMPEAPRGIGDGSYDLRGRWQSRQIELSGVFLPPNASYVAAARNKLIVESSLVYRGAWLIVDENPSRASFVRLSGRPSIVTVNERGRTEFSVGLRAADPIKYEWNDQDPEGYSVVRIPCKNSSSSGSGSGTVGNIGNTEVPIYIEIDGPIVGPATIQNETTGELILIIDSIDAGETLEIDTQNYEVSVDGDPTGARALLDTLADWIKLAPGANEFTFEDDGDATSDAVMRVYYRSGWIG